MHSFFFAGIVTGLVASTFAFPTSKSLRKRGSRTSAPSGCLTVGSDGDYSTIGDAISSLGDSTDSACIYISSGTYSEQLSIEYGGPLTLYGETSDTSTYASNTVLVTNTISSSDAGSLDASATIDITASNVSLYNLNVTNGYGYGAQAVALSADADQLGFYASAFSGYQDTLYAKSGTQYYAGCLIEGAVDYIFGGASAWFTQSTIMSTGGGSITANSRETNDSTWYVFDDVTVVSNGSDLSGEVYLGRPWRALARVMYQNSELSDIINAQGWTTLADDATPLYYEYDNSGDGSDTSDREYETTATGATSIETVLGDDYASWVDTSALDSTENSSSTGNSSSSSTISSGDSSSDASTSADASTCTPSAGGSSSVDDTPAIASAISSCGSGGTIVIPADTTYYLNSALDFSGCDGCDFQIEGTLQASDDFDYWAGEDAIISLSDISSAKVRSVTGTGVIDGNGQAAWDEYASNSSLARPTLFVVDGGSDLTIAGLSTINPPNVFYSVSGGASSIAFSSLNLSAVSTSDNDAKNTDGFDIGDSTYTTLTDITVVNDDDCVAFKAGSTYVTVTGISCTGSHGLSVGSLGKTNNDTVSNIYISNATMINSGKAAGIKTYPGGDHGTSTVTNVTWSGVVVQGSDYAIQIQSCYEEDEDYCEDNPGNADLTDIVFTGFSGETSGKYSPATSNVDCGADGTCGITIEDYSVTDPDATGEVLCANTDSDLGVNCTSGASG